MRLIAPVCVLLAAITFTGVAAADVPNYQLTLDARRFAFNYWENWRGEVNPCNRVIVRYGWLGDRNEFGFVYYGTCTIHLNTQVRWNWWNLCAIMTHEMGHVFGHRHTNAWGSIMNPKYPNWDWGYRFPACVPASS
jgi:hypothetical protein